MENSEPLRPTRLSGAKRVGAKADRDLEDADASSIDTLEPRTGW
jgi:hypothetical protein